MAATSDSDLWTGRKVVTTSEIGIMGWKKVAATSESGNRRLWLLQREVFRPREGGRGRRGALDAP